MEMDKVIYVKFSKERKKEFQISTTIVEDKGHKKVIKKSLGKDAKTHVMDIYKHYKELTCIFKMEKKIRICDCNLLDNGSVSFPYLDGLSAEEWIGERIRLNKQREVYRFLEDYYEILKGLAVDKGFQQTKEFIDVFGKIGISEELEYCNIANIDLIFSNIIINNSIWNVIDYEWVFYFSVPIHFIFYRAIMSSLSISLLKEEKIKFIFNKFGISELEIEEYKKMEENFQKYTKNENGQLSELYHKLPITSININQIDINKMFHPFHCKVKNSEAEKEVISFRTIDSENKVSIDLKAYVQYNQIIISLTNSNSIVKIKEIEAWKEGMRQNIEVFSHNAQLNINNDYYFTDVHPYFVLSNNEYEKVSIDYWVIKDNEDLVQQVVYYITNENKRKRTVRDFLQNKNVLSKETIKKFRAWKNLVLMKKIQKDERNEIESKLER